MTTTTQINTEFKLYINGDFVDASDGQSFRSINPANEEEWASFPSASPDDVNNAVAAADKALFEGEWPSLTATQRGKLLYKLADLIEEKAEYLGTLETIDSGKLAKETRLQTRYVADYYRYYAGLADKIEGSTLPIDKSDMFVYTERVPIGVVAAVVPWNAQLFLSATKIAPALAAGNTIVVKASEVAPATMLEFAKLVHEVGFPKGVFNVLTGFAERCSKPLTSHPDIARIAFTGGPETAKHIFHNAAENLAVISLELGGKSPMIVFDDANLESAVNGMLAGNFGASGQSCVAGSRVFIQEKIFDEVMAELQSRASKIVIGDPLADDTQVGPVATKNQVDHALQTLEATTAAGGEVLFGGKKPSGFSKGYYLEPTVVHCPTPGLASLENEFFAPVMSVMRFKDEDEAVKLANDTKFGLASGIFTENASRAIRVSKKIRSGIVYVNTYRAISPIAPFGGFKQSGYGREAGMEVIHDYTRTKTVWINTSEEPMANPFVMR